METRWGRSPKNLADKWWSACPLPLWRGSAPCSGLAALRRAAVLVLMLLGVGAIPASETNPPVPPQPGFTYIHDQVRDKPWSIHLVKVARAGRDYELLTTVGGGHAFGMGVVSEQVKTIPPTAGRPVAAINGDFFKNDPFPGDPEGLQIMRGELISAPDPNQACFWVDAHEDFHRTNVVAQFRVTWPNGSSTPFDLNRERANDEMVLYTAAVGSSTRTSGGLELILEHKSESCGNVLKVSHSCQARVKIINEQGNTPMGHSNWVLSIGPKLVARLPKLSVGAMLQISTATVPDLAGVTTAIGGKPSLVRGGKANDWRGIQLRHPRAAIGWNKDFLFMVEVDGRQSSSVGMTLPELAEYMAKLGCEEAINLDGGGSATLWVEGKVMNNPSEGRERPAANALVLVQKPKR